MKHWIIFGGIYTIVYSILAVAGINPEGTGTGAFLIPLITWIFILISLYLSNKLDLKRNRIFFVALMLAHYAVSLIFLPELFTEPRETKTGFWRMWEIDRNMIFITLAWYLTGQLIIWAAFFRKTRRTADELNNSGLSA